MKYRVVVLSAAQKEITEAYQWLYQQSPEQADDWLSGLDNAIRSLDTFPARCPLAPESNVFNEQLRRLLYGRGRGAYRILFAITDDTVVVLRVRHSARDMLQEP